MKNSLFTFITVCAASLAMPIGAASAQEASLDECIQRASDQYNENMQRCFGYAWHDSYERDICQYSAGQEHDGNVQACYASFPQGVSLFKIENATAYNKQQVL